MIHTDGRPTIATATTGKDKDSKRRYYARLVEERNARVRRVLRERRAR